MPEMLGFLDLNFLKDASSAKLSFVLPVVTTHKLTEMKTCQIAAIPGDGVRKEVIVGCKALNSCAASFPLHPKSFPHFRLCMY